MNVVALIGNLAADPELRYTSGGKAVCSIRLAVSRPGGQEADFFTVVAWERQAEVCNEYLMKGRRIGVEGRLHHSTWEVDETKDNVTTTSRRSKVEVIATRIELLGGPRTPAANPEFAASAVEGDAGSEGSDADEFAPRSPSEAVQQAEFAPA